MWKTLLRCGLVGGLIVFLWMMISWMVLPMHKTAMNKFIDESELTSCITRYAPSDGIYVIPSMEKKQEEAKSQTFVFVNVRRDVDFGNMTKPMICGLLTQMIGAGLITFLLLKTKAMKYWNRVWFVTIIGAIIALLGVFPHWNWWHFPTNWIALEMFDILVGWFLGGLVIAKLIKN